MLIVFGYPFLTFAVKILFSCMIIAQIAIMCIMFAKDSIISVGLLSPLLVITLLYALHFSRRHYTMARYLPSTMCREEDLRNNTQMVDHSWMRGEYLQPVLKHKKEYPENFPDALRHPVTDAAIPHDCSHDNNDINEDEEYQKDGDENEETPTTFLSNDWNDTNDSECSFITTVSSMRSEEDSQIQKHSAHMMTPQSSVIREAEEDEIDLALMKTSTVTLHPVIPTKEDEENATNGISIFKRLNDQIHGELDSKKE